MTESPSDRSDAQRRALEDIRAWAMSLLEAGAVKPDGPEPWLAELASDVLGKGGPSRPWVALPDWPFANSGAPGVAPSSPSATPGAPPLPTDDKRTINLLYKLIFDAFCVLPREGVPISMEKIRDRTGNLAQIIICTFALERLPDEEPTDPIRGSR